MDRDIIPFLGQKTSRERLRELDENRVTIWVAFGMVFGKWGEAIAGLPMQIWPVKFMGIDLTNVVWWSIFLSLVTWIILKEIDKMASEKAEDVTEKAGEVKEKAEEKLDEVTDSESN